MNAEDYEAHEAAARAYWTLEHERHAGRTWPRPRNEHKFSPVFANYLQISEWESLCGDLANAMRLRAYFDNHLTTGFVNRKHSLVSLSGGEPLAERYSKPLARLIQAESEYWAKGRSLGRDVRRDRAARLKIWSKTGTTPTRIRAAFRLARDVDAPSITVMNALVPRAKR